MIISTFICEWWYWYISLQLLAYFEVFMSLFYMFVVSINIWYKQLKLIQVYLFMNENGHSMGFKIILLFEKKKTIKPVMSVLKNRIQQCCISHFVKAF